MPPTGSAPLHVVTGAFGYSGQYITRRLLDAGVRVRTLTNSPDRPNPFDGQIETSPFFFDDPPHLMAALRGASVLYNTYWIRFNHPNFKQSDAVKNTLSLFQAAREAGVGRVVHVSITNPSLDSPLEYFRGKAILEQALIQSGLPYCILRPAVLFGGHDILINNIAWSLRRFPVVATFGTGQYRLQPIHVDDFAKLAVDQAAQTENRIIDAIGPETFTYRDLLRQVGQIIGHPRPIIPAPPRLAYLFAKLVGKWLGDTVLTWPEVRGLMSNLLCTNSPPTGQTRLTDWAKANTETLGTHYNSELARRTNRTTNYAHL